MKRCKALVEHTNLKGLAAANQQHCCWQQQQHWQVSYCPASHVSYARVTHLRYFWTVKGGVNELTQRNVPSRGGGGYRPVHNTTKQCMAYSTINQLL
jgi:hypothetical protein